MSSRLPLLMRAAVWGLAALALAAAPAAAGIHYKAVTKNQDPAGRSSQTVVDGQVSGGKARVEIRESANPFTEAGSYLITKDGGRTVYLVNPEDKTWAEFDLEGMFGAMGGILQGMGPLLKLEFSEPKVENLGDEDGGTVAGLSTRHARFRTSYSMKVKVLGMGQATDVVTDQEIWATSAVSDPGLGVWLRSSAPRTGNEQLDKLIAAEAGKVAGFPLKTVTVSTSKDKKGKESVSRITMEVTELKTGVTVPDAAFEIPAGYEETQIAILGQVPR